MRDLRLKGESPELRSTGQAQSMPMAWILAACVLAAALGLILFRVFQDQSEIARTPDFVLFYAASRLPVNQLYDPHVQTLAFDHVHHIDGGASSYGYFSYPPFVALALRPFAGMSFWQAYHAEQVVCVVLFLGALTTLAAAYYPGRYRLWVLIPAVAFLYEPLAAETWLNGQLSIIGFTSICLALAAVRRERPALAGLALSLCLYKPTLLILAIPMLVVTRQRRALGGFAAGALAWVATASAAYGVQIWEDYGHFLGSFGRMETLRPMTKYVDFIADASLVGRTQHSSATMFLMGLGALMVMFFVLWRRRAAPHLLWAIAIAWTLFLNFYVPIYDTILLIPVAIAILPGLRRHRAALGLAVVVLTSWVTQPLARAVHVQLLSLEILGLGLFLIGDAVGYFGPGQPIKNRAAET